MTAVNRPNDPDAITTERLREGIEQTRAGMSATITALETRLPDELRGRVGLELEHVEAKVRDVVREHLAEAKTLVKEELAEAKTALRVTMDEAESKIKKGLTEGRDAVKKDLRAEIDGVEAKLKTGLAEARDTVKKDLHQAFQGAKHTVRAATLGKVEDLATNLGDAMNDTRDTLVDTIRNNPLPAVLTGVGLAWLLMNRSKSARSNGGPYASTDRYGHASNAGVNRGDGGAIDGARRAIDKVGSAIGDAAHRASETAGHLVHDASGAARGAMHQASTAAGAAIQGTSSIVDRVATQTSGAAGALVHGAGDASSQLAHRAGEAAVHAAQGARAQARRVEQGLHSTLQDSPLALAAVALSVGAAVGFSLPRSRAEDKLMGEARDMMMGQAEGIAHDAAAAIGQLSEKTAEVVKQTVGAKAEKQS
jgi:hypothetical protein